MGGTAVYDRRTTVTIYFFAGAVPMLALTLSAAHASFAYVARHCRLAANAETR